MKSMQPTQSLFMATVYRPPEPYTAFLTDSLNSYRTLSWQIIFKFFMTLLFTWKSPQAHSGFRSHHRLQHVSGPTHCHSHTLDLLLSRGINVVHLNIFFSQSWTIGPPFYYSMQWPDLG
ncbi:unnamed protein product [Oncorhynchus mykiss]|uniref:Uncharacterized protein n=1 Tax=Oncorhynchus mykiss TaxID=8022 RepID=A0A060WTD3_ONCMY|nr:unnamed protein product [Oncorhynchus mykiss]